MRTIWLIRHAESRGNAGEVTDLPHSIALTELGHRQAVELADQLPQAPGLIVVSRYRRTVETARPTMQRFPKTPVVEWPIHEFTFLATDHYRGTTQEHRRAPALAFWDRREPQHCDGEGAESFNEFMGRIRDCLDRLRNSSEGFIAVFTHGYVMKAILWECLYCGDQTPSAFMAGFQGFHRSYPVENGMIVPMLADEHGRLFIGSAIASLQRKGLHSMRGEMD
jgi:probable phosphoglycerate mutase